MDKKTLKLFIIVAVNLTVIMLVLTTTQIITYDTVERLRKLEVRVAKLEVKVFGHEMVSHK